MSNVLNDNNEEILSYKNMKAVSKELEILSDTWRDFWEFLCYSHSRPVQAIKLKYNDILDKYILLPSCERYSEVLIPVNDAIKHILERRKHLYPDDVYIFQSHSNRIKYFKRPITLIAFNRALRKASILTLNKPLSSKYALYFEAKHYVHIKQT